MVKTAKKANWFRHEVWPGLWGRIVAGGVLASAAHTAMCADYLVVGVYYTRASKKACAEGHYVLRDARSLEEAKKIRNELDAIEGSASSADYFRHPRVVAVYRYESLDAMSYGLSNRCTYLRYAFRPASSRTEAERDLRRAVELHKSHYLTSPEIFLIWNGGDMEGQAR